jgi:starvation-inducible outer membrane lipoprotein
MYKLLSLLLVLAYTLTLAGCARIPPVNSIQQNRQTDALLAKWEKAMVRPCVKSGGRLVC